MSPATPIIGRGGPSGGADRRREKRYQIDLPASAEAGGAVVAVMVSDLSPSGALINAADASGSFAGGAELILRIAEYGPIEARIVHVGHGFYGLQFLYPHRHRDRLIEWLKKEVGAA